MATQIIDVVMAIFSILMFGVVAGLVLLAALMAADKWL